MIALETSAKIGKSPKKPQVELRESDVDETDQESDGASINSEMHELESADEGLADDSGSDNKSISENEMEEDEDNTKYNSISKSEGNPGWADVMQKILKTKKPKRKKTLVLSKAKKLCEVTKKDSEKEDFAFEIDGGNKEVKTETDDVSKSKEYPVQLKRKRKDVSLGIRVKPSSTEREHERMLQKIATKGVVQLFNAVRQQQSDISKKLTEAGPLERKREQVLKNIDKRTFLDVLMGNTKSVRVGSDSDVKPEERKDDDNKQSEQHVWSVLQDDFVMGAKLKDWDKKATDDEDSSAPEELDSDE